MEYIAQYPAPLPGEEKGEGKLGEAPYIHPTCHIRASTIGAWADVGPYSSLVESSFGDYSYTAGYAQIIYSEVGKYCSIASHVRISPVNHPQWRVTQHHMTYRRRQYGFGEVDDLDFFEWRRENGCRIGHDVWIGHNAIIMPGVTIGTGAIVGSGSVVTKDVGPYEIAVGVAAKVIRKRFSDEIIERLLESQWWDWDRATMEERFDDLLNVQTFISKYVTV